MELWLSERGCHGHGVEGVILMGDAPLLGVLAKYPISWREGFGAVNPERGISGGKASDGKNVPA